MDPLPLAGIEGGFYGELLPGTCGCVDINDVDTPCCHVCDGRAGGIVESSGEDEHAGPKGAQWRLGTRVRMAPAAPGSGHCAAWAWATGPDHLPVIATEAPGFPVGHFDWGKYESGLPSASFQWKGTDTHLRFMCPACNAECEVEGQSFAYNVGCPLCRTFYSVDWSVPVERTTGRGEL